MFVMVISVSYTFCFGKTMSTEYMSIIWNNIIVIDIVKQDKTQ